MKQERNSLGEYIGRGNRKVVRVIYMLTILFMNELLELPPIRFQTNLQKIFVLCLLTVQSEIVEEEKKKAEREGNRRKR